MLLASFSTFMQQATPGARPQGNMLTALVPFILVFVIFYVLIILPSRKKQKKHQDMVEIRSLPQAECMGQLWEPRKTGLS